MHSIPNKDNFSDAYADKAPWDIPRAQPAFVEAADRVAGQVLDSGCGTGENALFFAERGHAVTAIDFLEEPIVRARPKADERGLKVDFRVHDALALEALGETFDTAIDCGLFHVFADEDRWRYVAGLTQVVRPGGMLLLECFSDQEPGEAGPRRISQADLREAFAAGWTIESITPTQFQVIPEYADTFTPGGPKAWFVVARRT
ncbi:MAG: class I SAM-dependent methyltransferase [Planctomycetota bacterium]|nr:MAG: class I SAM-dependent methyltransferase [Planctomycetota bacterium]